MATDRPSVVPWFAAATILAPNLVPVAAIGLVSIISLAAALIAAIWLPEDFEETVPASGLQRHAAR
jgi:hypothetical protein